VTAGPPPAADASYRCAIASGLRGDVLAGTASTVRAFVLVEHPGPWGVDALRDARLPDGVGEALRERSRTSGVRVLLVRRHGRRAAGAGPGQGTRVLAAHAHPHRPRLEAITVDDVRALLDVDLAALRAEGSLGWPEEAGPVLAVCTHGRHDACCAASGRPVAAALAAAHPEETWEVSHIGGDRFAGNLLVLPHGLYYGRLDRVSALTVAGAHLAGQVDLDHLRGRSGWSMPVQHAEVALRRELGETRLDAVQLVRARSDGARTSAVLRVGGQEWEVEVETRPGAESHLLTCRATHENAAPQHAVRAITLLAGPVGDRAQ
jgi:hypothetical protein